MGAVVPVVTAVAAAVSAGATIISATKGAPAAPRITAQPVVQQTANSSVTDALLRRRGVGANQVTGSGGAESGTAAKKSFMGN